MKFKKNRDKMGDKDLEDGYSDDNFDEDDEPYEYESNERNSGFYSKREKVSSWNCCCFGAVK